MRKLGMVTINLDLPCLTWRDLPAGVMFPCYTMFLGSVVCAFSRLLETFVGQKSTRGKKNASTFNHQVQSLYISE